jgi:hypothetical protein
MFEWLFGKKKEKVWYFHSPYKAEELDLEVKEGKISRKEEEWNIGNYPPITLKKKGGVEQVYFVSPAKVNPSYPEYVKMDTKDLSAGTLKRIIEQRFIAELLRPIKKPMDMNPIILVGLGIGVGIIVLWILSFFGIRIF